MEDMHYEILEKYCRLVADVLGLVGFKITVEREAPNDEDAYACCGVVEGRSIVIIRFCENFHEVDPDDQREIVIHELLHGLYNRMFYYAMNEYNHVASTAQDDMFIRGLTDLYELATDKLAFSLSKAIDKDRIPMIEWPKDVEFIEE